MKISYECGACFLRQAREAMDLSCDDDLLKIEIMNDIFNLWQIISQRTQIPIEPVP